MEDSSSHIMLKDAVDTSRRNETTLNKILGGLLVLAALQTGFIGAGAWVASTVISNSQEIQVLKEQMRTLHEQVKSGR